MIQAPRNRQGQTPTYLLRRLESRHLCTSYSLSLSRNHQRWSRLRECFGTTGYIPTLYKYIHSSYSVTETAYLKMTSVSKRSKGVMV